LFGGRQEPTTSLKIIEYVNGVKLKCKSVPGDRIEITGLVITNIGRTFQYRNYMITSPSGYSNIYLPYSNEKRSSSVFVERYYLQNSSKVIQLKNITEQMVQEGTEIFISFVD
jgi:DNA replicative helicase MCM subunit Mcm2 (Cdc46/Mcm family)